MSTVTEIPDVFDPWAYADGIPHESFHFLREHQPVCWQDEHAVGDWPAGPGFWAVTRHADVDSVLRAASTYSSWFGATQIRDPDPADLPFIQRMMLNMDPPDHGKLRRIVSKAFTPRRIERFTEHVTARARRLIDAVISRGHCDFAAEVSDDFPLANLADLLGVPESDRGMLLRWTNRIIGYQDPEHADELRDADGKPVNPRSPAALADMFGYAHELAEYKREHQDDDVMSALATADLTDAELEMFFFLLAVAGNDTVRSAAPGALLAFAQHPEQHRLVRHRPDLLNQAVEESLRWHPPVLSFRRTARTDTALAGTPIAAGEKVVVFHASANFDPEVFDDPMRFDITRSPNPHLAFGDGPHVCLGAHFARLQLRALLGEALPRLTGLEVAGPVDHLVSNFINGIKHLPLRFTPAAIPA